jgi:ATP-dependent Lhr-like helicase
MKMTGEKIIKLDEYLTDFLFNYLNWGELNKVQKETIPLILNQKDTLVIAPTASGKTEAVLIPIFNDIIKNNLKPTSVLYISPLKALINDMDKRIGEWCHYFGFSSTKWHGDVSPHQKKCYINNPTDFLSITPESLEVILMNKNSKEKKRIFQNIKYVIIDEIHYFVESDRGTQLNSLINRISKYNTKQFIKIGLSATIGNPELVSKWLNHQKPAEIVNFQSKKKPYFNVICGDKPHIKERLSKYVNKNKILIFTQSRKNAETYTTFFQETYKYDKVYIHHSSIDKKSRENVEEKFKNETDAFMISTSTLELGIDIGNIHAVVQIKPPASVSSLLQRMGRSGRTGNQNSKTIIFYQNDAEIFISLAEIQLIKQNKVENIKIPEKPLDIYFHQILSTIIEYMKIDKNQLYTHLKDCYVFEKITFDEYKNMIKNMEKNKFIKKDQKYLTIGPKFEEKFGKLNFLNFYSVFCPSYEYNVKNGNIKIGTLDPTYALTLKKGGTFILSGTPWIVKEINYKKNEIRVQKIKLGENIIPQWFADSPTLSYEITREIYNTLTTKNITTLPLNKKFDETSQNKIKEYIKHATNVGFKKDTIPIEYNPKTKSVHIYTFAGHKVNILLSLIYQLHYNITTDCNAYYASFKITEEENMNGIKTEVKIEDIINILKSTKTILKNPENKKEIYTNLDEFYKNKFINLIPKEYSNQLKYEILFEEENLIKLTENNKIILCEKTKFKKWK